MSVVDCATLPRPSRTYPQFPAGNYQLEYVKHSTRRSEAGNTVVTFTFRILGPTHAKLSVLWSVTMTEAGQGILVKELETIGRKPFTKKLQGTKAQVNRQFIEICEKAFAKWPERLTARVYAQNEDTRKVAYFVGTK